MWPSSAGPYCLNNGSFAQDSDEWIVKHLKWTLYNLNRIMQTVNVSIAHLGIKTRRSALKILLVREKHNHGGNRL